MSKSLPNRKIVLFAKLLENYEIHIKIIFLTHAEIVPKSSTKCVIALLRRENIQGKKIPISIESHPNTYEASKH